MRGVEINLIFTYSDLKYLSQSSTNFYNIVYIRTLNQRGETYFLEILENFVDNPLFEEKQIMIICFSSKEDINHLKFVCYLLQTFQQKYRKNKQRKTILLILRQEKYKDDIKHLDLDFSTSLSQWKYFVIENLHDSFYKYRIFIFVYSTF